jgi:hypothetical protein
LKTASLAWLVYYNWRIDKVDFEMFKNGLTECMIDAFMDTDISNKGDVNDLVITHKGKDICNMYDFFSDYFGVLYDKIIDLVEESSGI